MGFLLERTIDLASFGWADCAIKLKAVPYKEIKELSLRYRDADKTDPKLEEEAFDFLKSKFISGEGIDENGKKVSISPGQIEELPADIVLHCIQSLIAVKADPNG